MEVRRKAMTTLEALEQRVAALENQMVQKTNLLSKNGEEDPHAYLHRVMEQARQDLPRMQQHWQEVFRAMGVTGEPISAEQVQELWKQAGIKPEDCLLSKGIREMREE
jgi:hypothetical protein